MSDRDGNVTIDGRVASGKSTVAKIVGSKLGYRIFEAGMFYRAVTWFILSAGLPHEDGPSLVAALAGIELSLGQDGNVLLRNVDITGVLREPVISQLTPTLSELRAVRATVEPLRHRIIAEGKVIVVRASDTCPDARFPFWLDADLNVRASRWQAEMRLRGVELDIETAIAQVDQRDKIDSSRAKSPLLIPNGAIHIDTTSLTPVQVAARVLGVVQGLR